MSKDTIISRITLLLAVCICGLMSCSDKDGIPSSQIHYTTVDNKVLALQIQENFGGAKIISNTYFAEDSVCIIEFSTDVTEIGEHAFSRSASLTDIIIPESVTKIGRCAFWDCSSLTNVTIPSSVTEIGGCAFSDCSSLTSVIIPPSVTKIDDCAFSDCASLTSICIPASVRKIENNVFSDCSSLTSIKVESNNAIYDSREDCNAIIHTESNTLISGCQNTVIPESVTGIGVRAFSGCLSLTSISIPPSVTEIEALAFWGCSSLTTVKVSKDTHIADSAFEDCPNVRIERY